MLKDFLNKKNLIYMAIALLLFCVVVVSYLKLSHRDNNFAPSIIVLGDSILGENRGESSVCQELSRLLGKEVTNFAFGGTTAAKSEKNDEQRNLLSLASLTSALISGDFGPQQTVFEVEAAASYYEAVVDQMDETDFSNVDIMFIEYGMNDYHQGIALNDKYNRYSLRTYEGSLRYLLSSVEKKYPNMRIILLTPPFSWYPDYGTNCENQSFGGEMLCEYVKAEEEIAAEYGVDIIDFYNLYKDYDYDSWRQYTLDGIHPNETSRKLMAQTIYSYLMEME